MRNIEADFREANHIIDDVDKRSPRKRHAPDPNQFHASLVHDINYDTRSLFLPSFYFNSNSLLRSIAFCNTHCTTYVHAHTHTHTVESTSTGVKYFFVPPSVCLFTFVNRSIDNSTGPVESFQESRRYRKWIKLEIYRGAGALQDTSDRW